ncbi:MAG: recombinase family protein [Actinobacteria bacterium]|nr:recombinase family protein [Actinomycetota bacterium]
MNKIQEKLKCAIYTRISTDNQAEVNFNSCEAQEEKIKLFISSQENLEVFKVYSDLSFTGANINRPALINLINDVKENKIDLVVSYKIDRLTRSPKDFYSLIELFDKYDVNFISVTERFDTSTPSGRLLRNIMLTFAQFERELASERTKDKMVQRAQKGMWNGDIVPFGYKSENKKLIINSHEAEAIKVIYENYISGISIAKIAKQKNISKGRVFTILRNPIYAGKIKYDGKLLKGNHEQIISEDLFNIVQDIHKKRIKKTRLSKNFLLSGLIKCKECNSYMTPSNTNKKQKGKLKRYRYYRCTSTLKKDWDFCSTKQVNATRLENYIFQNLERLSQDKQYIDSLIFKLNFNKKDYRLRLEPSHISPENMKISPEIFMHTLQHFIKILPLKKGIDKNLWVKKFINKVDYSKDEIAVSIYYR